MSEQPPADREEWIRWVREKLEREEAEKHEPPPNGHDPDAELLRQLRIDIGQLNCDSSPEEIAAIVDRIAAGIGDEIQHIRLEHQPAPQRLEMIRAARGVAFV